MIKTSKNQYPGSSSSSEFVEMMIEALVRDFQSAPFSSGSVIRFIRHLPSGWRIHNPAGQDIVTPVTDYVFGREDKKCLL